MRRVSAAEANRQFSKLLRDVAAGETVIVTSRGQPVAQIGPVDREAEETARRRAALQAHLAEVAKRPILPIPKWTRAELYEDEPDGAP